MEKTSYPSPTNPPVSSIGLMQESDPFAKDQQPVCEQKFISFPVEELYSHRTVSQIRSHKEQWRRK